MMQGRLKLPETIGSQQCADFTEGPDVAGRPPGLFTICVTLNQLNPARCPAPRVPESEPERPRPTDRNAANLSLPDQLYQEAYVAYRQKDYDEAHDLLDDCLALKTDHVDAQALLRLIEGRQKTAAPRRDVSQYVPTKTARDPDWADLLRQFCETAGFPVPEMVRIPAGPFLMGSDPKRDPSADKDEQPQIAVDLPEYFMGKYPITVEEYRVFVEQGA